MAQANGPYIQYQNVEVRYTEFVAGLKGVNLSIDRGEFVFFVGRTGSGKSTMLKLLTREVVATSGRVTLTGRDLGAMRGGDIPSLRREMGIVPQDFALLPRKKVWENVGYAMRAVGASKREVRRRVPEILERVNILHRADAYPGELSGGEQQRVAIARALINNPSLLIADEPTGNLDPEHSWEIVEILRQLNLRGTTVLVASHDMLVIERAGGRIVRLENGLVASDTRPAPETPIDVGLFATPVQPVLVPEPTVNPEPEPQPIVGTESESEPAIEQEAAPEPVDEPEPITLDEVREEVTDA